MVKELDKMLIKEGSRKGVGKKGTIPFYQLRHLALFTQQVKKKGMWGSAGGGG